MKRNDGLNRSVPLASFMFGHGNPERVHVIKGWSSWRVYRGTLLLTTRPTFAQAIAVAHEAAQ